VISMRRISQHFIHLFLAFTISQLLYRHRYSNAMRLHDISLTTCICSACTSTKSTKTSPNTFTRLEESRVHDPEPAQALAHSRRKKFDLVLGIYSLNAGFIVNDRNYGPCLQSIPDDLVELAVCLYILNLYIGTNVACFKGVKLFRLPYILKSHSGKREHLSRAVTHCADSWWQ
jgi:hypothetical protein